MTIRNFFNDLSPEEIKQMNEESWERSDGWHAEFKDAFLQKKCNMCNCTLKNFDPNKVCLHWLLYPKGMKNRYVKKLFKSGVGFFRTATYLRWIANLESPLKNINNLNDEISENKLFELTVAYKNFEWSFSCSPGCYKGEKDSQYPHFHFQMKNEGRVIFKFNQDHVQFSEHDLFTLKAIEDNPDKIQPFDHHALGVQEMMGLVDPETLLESMTTTRKDSQATFSVHTFLEAKEGEKIKVDDIVKLLKEREKTGESFARLARKLDVKQKSIIYPGDGLPEMAKRSEKKR